MDTRFHNFRPDIFLLPFPSINHLTYFVFKNLKKHFPFSKSVFMDNDHFCNDMDRNSSNDEMLIRGLTQIKQYA